MKHNIEQLLEAPVQVESVKASLVKVTDHIYGTADVGTRGKDLIEAGVSPRERRFVHDLLKRTSVEKHHSSKGRGRFDIFKHQGHSYVLSFEN